MTKARNPTQRSVDKAATFQSGSRAKGMASNIPQQIEKSPV